MVREPAVAGHFYPGDPLALRSDVERFLRDASSSARPTPAHAAVVPHAGYMYSGRIAGAVYAEVRLPRTVVVLCPNHTGRGAPIAVMNRGGWRTPLGVAAIDERLADRVLEASSSAACDAVAHEKEHSLEVQIPFLQVLVEDLRFVPICIGSSQLDILTGFGRDLAAALATHDEPSVLIISSDMSHHIDAAEARRRDRIAIDRIEALDPVGLHRAVAAHDISMCGIAPAVAGLTAAKAAGARSARLIAYGNSGDTSGDYDRVVAYAGLAVS